MYGSMSSKLRWGLVMAGIVTLLILSIWGIFSIAKNLFNNTQETQEVKTQETFEQEYNRAGVAVSYELQGPIVADSEFLSYRITVSRTQRVFQLMRGYQGFVEKEQTYTNNESAYNSFLLAIEGGGFFTINENAPTDERGSCPLGRRYLYTVNDNGQQTFRTWNTSCRANSGNSRATSEVRTLFQKQIPDFSQLTKNTGLQ